MMGIRGVGAKGYYGIKGQALAAELRIAPVKVIRAFLLGNAVMYVGCKPFHADVVYLGGPAHEPLFLLVLAGPYVIHAV